MPSAPSEDTFDRSAVLRDEGLDLPRRPGVHVGALRRGAAALHQTVITMLNEATRTRLIGEIASVLQEQPIPPETHAAGLTLIGWLARRMPCDCAASAPSPNATRVSSGEDGRGASPQQASRA